MSREWQMYWDDMRRATLKVQSYTNGMNSTDFANNELVRDAVLRNLEIIGEAAKHIPPHVKDKVAGLDWRRIIGFRDIVAHAYFGIDAEILWDIVSQKVPELRRLLEIANLAS